MDGGEVVGNRRGAGISTDFVRVQIVASRLVIDEIGSRVTEQQRLEIKLSEAHGQSLQRSR